MFMKILSNIMNFPGEGSGLTKLHLVSRLGDVELKLTDRDNEFANFTVKGLSGILLQNIK